MPLWSRVLKETGPELAERKIPLRRLQVAAASPVEKKPTAAEEAAALLERSRRQAAAIKEEAMAAREQAIKAGRAEGEAQGYQQGLARAEKEGARISRKAEKLREEARQVLREAQAVYKKTLEEAEEKIIELVMAIAAKVIGHKLEQEPQLAVDLTRKAILRVTAGQVYTIYASRETAEILQQRRQELLAETESGARLQIIVDPALGKGGCRVETENGFIDAAVDTQLAAVRKILQGGAGP